MYSDDWLLLGYSKLSTTYVVDGLIHYSHWMSHNSVIVGTNISFEYADDYHYEFLPQAWEQLLALMSEGGDGQSEEAVLKKYFSKNDGLSFMKMVDDAQIEYTKAAYY